MPGKGFLRRRWLSKDVKEVREHATQAWKKRVGREQDAQRPETDVCMGCNGSRERQAAAGDEPRNYRGQ